MNLGESIVSGMLGLFTQMGVKIQKCTEDNIVYITVPECDKSTKINPMHGDKIAKRIQELTDDLCGGKRVITYKYKIES